MKVRFFYMLCFFSQMLIWGQKPIISFEQTTIVDTIFYYGDGQDNLQIPSKQYYFFFSNIGKAPLIMQYSLGSDPAFNCQYPKEPIAPGGKACLTICFPETRRYNMDKAFSIQSNADTSIIIRVKRRPVLVDKMDSISEIRTTYKKEVCNCNAILNQGVWLKQQAIIQNSNASTIEHSKVFSDSLSTKLVVHSKDEPKFVNVDSNNLLNPDVNEVYIWKEKKEDTPDAIITSTYANEWLVKRIFIYKHLKKGVVSKEKVIRYANEQMTSILITTCEQRKFLLRFHKRNGHTRNGLKIIYEDIKKYRCKKLLYANGKWEIIDNKWHKNKRKYTLLNPQ